MSSDSRNSKRSIKQQYDQENQLGRRDFVKSTLSLSVGAVVASAIPASSLAADVVEPTPPQSKKQQGYHLSQHILDYYKAAAL